MRSIRKESPTTTDKYIMTTALEATEKDFEQMMQPALPSARQWR
jgi:hypothetical protein